MRMYYCAAYLNNGLNVEVNITPVHGLDPAISSRVRLQGWLDFQVPAPVRTSETGIILRKSFRFLGPGHVKTSVFCDRTYYESINFYRARIAEIPVL
jgi:hypothetical protein